MFTKTSNFRACSVAKNGGSGCTEIEAKIAVLPIPFFNIELGGRGGLSIFVRRNPVSCVVRGAYMSGENLAITSYIVNACFRFVQFYGVPPWQREGERRKTCNDRRCNWDALWNMSARMHIAVQCSSLPRASAWMVHGTRGKKRRQQWQSTPRVSDFFILSQV